jgi:hypothetical protein
MEYTTDRIECSATGASSTISALMDILLKDDRLDDS